MKKVEKGRVYERCNVGRTCACSDRQRRSGRPCAAESRCLTSNPPIAGRCRNRMQRLLFFWFSANPLSLHPSLTLSLRFCFLAVSSKFVSTEYNQDRAFFLCYYFFFLRQKTKTIFLFFILGNFKNLPWGF